MNTVLESQRSVEGTLTSGIRTKSSGAGASVEDHTELSAQFNAFTPRRLVWIVSAWAFCAWGWSLFSSGLVA